MFGRQTLSSVWSPLRQPVFRAFWCANVVSLVGTWMHDVGAAWLMTSLAPSPFMVAMVQTATTLPLCLLAIPAGALADILDRRRLLLITQWWMLAASAVLGALTVLGATTPVVLLIFTFVLGVGGSLNMPVWQAALPELVPRELLPPAVTLNSVGFNIARVLGPALGGFVVGMIGPGFTFLLRSISYFGVIGVLKSWKRERREQTLPEERMIGAMRTGLRYVKNASEVRGVLVHVGFFSVFGCSLWAFLPVVARQLMHLSALGYGVLMGLFGAGGLLAAMFMPRLREVFSLNTLVAAGSIVFAGTMASLGYIRSLPVTGCAMVLSGMSWLVVLSILNTEIQTVIPSWVRGRVVSVYMLVLFGAMAGGSAFWGSVALTIGVPATLGISAVCLVVQTAITWRHRLSSREDLDLTPSRHRPRSGLAEEPELYGGPVLVVNEYRIDPARAEEFTEAMSSLKKIRLRDGAIRWNLFRDLSDQGSYNESFVTESWAEHLRQHERFTVSDREALDKAHSFHIGGGRPEAKHFIAEAVRKA
jgi:MFS family permease